MCKSPASPEIPTRGHAHGAVEKRERSEQGLCGKIGRKAVNRKLLHIAQGVCRKIWAEKGRKGAADKLRPSPEWQAPPFRVIARSEASLALPLGELSPKVTERALQALLNGNSNQGEGCFSLSGGCAASSPKGRAKLRNDRSGNLPHPGVYSRELIFDVISRILSCRPLEEFGSSCSTFFRA